MKKLIYLLLHTILYIIEKLYPLFKALFYTLCLSWLEFVPVRTLIYKCHPNGTIVAANPCARTYFSVFASTSDQICSTYWTDNNRSYVEIIGCGKDENIVVSFMNRVLADDNIISGKETMNYLIICKEISPTGVHRTVVNAVVNVVQVPMFAQEVTSISPSFSVFTKIYKDLTMKEEVQHALVGTKLYWVIQGPAKYKVIPINCTAFPGTIPGRIFQTTIIDGCTLDDKLVENFRVLGPGTIAADLYAFRFYNSPILALQCTVRVCPIWSNFCDTPCFARRKRSIIIGTGAYVREETVNTRLSILKERNVGVSLNLSLPGLSFIPVISILLHEVLFLFLVLLLWTG